MSAGTRISDGQDKIQWADMAWAWNNDEKMDAPKGWMGNKNLRKHKVSRKSESFFDYLHAPTLRIPDSFLLYTHARQWVSAAIFYRLLVTVVSFLPVSCHRNISGFFYLFIYFCGEWGTRIGSLVITNQFHRKHRCCDACVHLYDFRYVFHYMRHSIAILRL